MHINLLPPKQPNVVTNPHRRGVGSVSGGGSPILILWLSATLGLTLTLIACGATLSVLSRVANQASLTRVTRRVVTLTPLVVTLTLCGALTPCVQYQLASPIWLKTSLVSVCLADGKGQSEVDYRSIPKLPAKEIYLSSSCRTAMAIVTTTMRTRTPMHSQHMALEDANPWTTQTPATTKIPPAYDGRTSWFQFLELSKTGMA
eukprot:86121-Amphidinium_carterae.1